MPPLTRSMSRNIAQRATTSQNFNERNRTRNRKYPTLNENADDDDAMINDLPTLPDEHIYRAVYRRNEKRHKLLLDSLQIA